MTTTPDPIAEARKAVEERERTAAWTKRHGLDEDEAFQLQMELVAHLRSLLTAHARLAEELGRVEGERDRWEDVATGRKIDLQNADAILHATRAACRGETWVAPGVDPVLDAVLDLRSRLAHLERERDEARREVERLAKAVEANRTRAAVLPEVTRQRDEARRERDEAVAARAHLAAVVGRIVRGCLDRGATPNAHDLHDLVMAHASLSAPTALAAITEAEGAIGKERVDG